MSTLSGVVLPLAAVLTTLAYLPLDLVLVVVGGVLGTVVILGGVLALWLRRRMPRLRKGTVGIFHPHANGGGGGERVLWCAVQALQQSFPEAQLLLYCEVGLGAAALAAGAARAFNLRVEPTFTVVPLRRVHLLNPGRYPRFTLLGQAWGSARLALDCLHQAVPEVWLDTTGWAFAYPLARVCGARVAAYCHYPTVSTDMLARVSERETAFNNGADVAGSPIKSCAKVLYYHAFAALYGLCGACADVVMVNSSWTLGHITALWWSRRQPALVFPPCDTASLQALPLDRKLKRLYLVSVAQFRPEKDHELQLQALAAARQRAAAAPAGAGSEAVLAARLVLVGGVRHEADHARLRALQRMAEALGLADVVEWHVGIDCDELRALLAGAVGGLHSMRDEHFGISVVEYCAAGVVPIAHDSGGPKADIVCVPGAGDADGQRTGFLCSSAAEYEDAITALLGMEQRERMRIAAAARRHVAQFSDESFRQRFVHAMLPVLGGGHALHAELAGSADT